MSHKRPRFSWASASNIPENYYVGVKPNIPEIANENQNDLNEECSNKTTFDDYHVGVKPNVSDIANENQNKLYEDSSKKLTCEENYVDLKPNISEIVIESQKKLHENPSNKLTSENNCVDVKPNISEIDNENKKKQYEQCSANVLPMRPGTSCPSDVFRTNQLPPDLVAIASQKPKFIDDELALALEKDLTELATGFALVIPVTSDSKPITSDRAIFHYNIPEENRVCLYEGHRKLGRVTCHLYAQFIPGFARSKQFLVASGTDRKRKFARVNLYPDAYNNLIQYCNIVKLKDSYFEGGGLPDFLKHKKPCDLNPPVYKILTKDDTGDLVDGNCHSILEEFEDSYEEDVFFHDILYSKAEQQLLVKVAGSRTSNLGVRWYEESSYNECLHRICHHTYVCIYKKRSGIDIYNEVKHKRNGHHPKYIIWENDKNNSQRSN